MGIVAHQEQEGSIRTNLGYYEVLRSGTWTKLIAEDKAGWDDYTSPVDVKPTSLFAPSWSRMFGNFNGYRFAPKLTTEFQSTFHVKHDYVLNSPMFFHIHWVDCSDSVGGNVNWKFQYAIAKGHGQQAFYESAVFEMQQASAGSKFHMISECQIPLLLDVEPDTLIIVYAAREGNSPLDTCKNDVFALTSDFHYLSTSKATLNRIPNFYE